MTRELGHRIGDLLSALDRIEHYRHLLYSEDDATTEMALDAILHNLTVVGEAVKSLPSTLRDQYPTIPWPSIIGLRNIVVHQYFDIREDVIADIAANHLSELRATLAAITTDLD